MLLLVGHQDRVGKDTFCNHLVECAAAHNIGAICVSFASPSKTMCYNMFQHLGFPNPLDKDFDDKKADFLPMMGKTVREVLIWFNEEVIKPKCGQNIWADLLIGIYNANVDYPLFIVRDFRYPIEYEIAQKRSHPYTVKITRPGVESKNFAEKALLGFDKWDEIIDNDSDLGNLKLKAAQFFRRHFLGK